MNGLTLSFFHWRVQDALPTRFIWWQSSYITEMVLITCDSIDRLQWFISYCCMAAFDGIVPGILSFHCESTPSWFGVPKYDAVFTVKNFHPFLILSTSLSLSTLYTFAARLRRNWLAYFNTVLIEPDLSLWHNFQSHLLVRLNSLIISLVSIWCPTMLWSSWILAILISAWPVFAQLFISIGPFWISCQKNWCSIDFPSGIVMVFTSQGVICQCPQYIVFDISGGVQRAASPWRTLGIRSCRTFCSDLAW